MSTLRMDERHGDGRVSELKVGGLNNTRVLLGGRVVRELIIRT